MGILAKFMCKLHGHDYKETDIRPDGWGYLAITVVCTKCGDEKLITKSEDDL
jgi:hypothetical protein